MAKKKPVKKPADPPGARPEKKIAILGTTPSRLQGPIAEDSGWEIWTIGPGGKDAHRFDRLFEVHGWWPKDFDGYLNDLSKIKPPQPNPRFEMGELVHHKLFGYRGVVVGIDATFEGTETWYVRMAKTKPPRNQPWYHVLVHDASHQTYVAERNLHQDETGEPIAHPFVSIYFDELVDGQYVLTRPLN